LQISSISINIVTINLWFFFQMATSPRQYGRRGVTNTTNTTNPNAVNSDSGVALSPSSTGSTSTPPRRYVLDVPTGRTSRTTTNRISDEYDETTTRRSGDAVAYTSVRSSDLSNENGEQLSRSGSRDYYYRDSGNYVEDASVKKLIESNVTYTNTALEDQEVQALTAQATPDVKNYPINVDANPELIVRPNTQRVTYTQDIAVRYLKPGTPPPPGVRNSFIKNLRDYHKSFFLCSLLLFVKFVHHHHHQHHQ
jgi:hypothetical protein